MLEMFGKSCTIGKQMWFVLSTLPRIIWNNEIFSSRSFTHPHRCACVVWAQNTTVSRIFLQRKLLETLKLGQLFVKVTNWVPDWPTQHIWNCKVRIMYILVYMFHNSSVTTHCSPGEGVDAGCADRVPSARANLQHRVDAVHSQSRGGGCACFCLFSTLFYLIYRTLNIKSSNKTEMTESWANNRNWYYKYWILGIY